MEPSNKEPKYDGQLCLGFLAYIVGNYLAVAIATGPMRQIPILGIFGILLFFSFIGPLLAIFVVLSVQLRSEVRPFQWLFVTGFVVAMIIAGFLNLVAFANVSASI